MSLQQLSPRRRNERAGSQIRLMCQNPSLLSLPGIELSKNILSREEKNMKRSALFLCCLLVVLCAQFAFGQAGDGLNEQQRLGRQVVAQSCGVCHLPPARNARTYGPLLNKSAGGGDESVIREYITNGTSRMPSFKYFLQPAEIDAIIAYLKTVSVGTLPAPTSSAAVVQAAPGPDQLLSGVISSRSAGKLEGVAVLAKLEGSTITTSVYTDETGHYYFPRLPGGKYRVWAQALGFETARSSVDLTTARQHDVVLQEITDPEKRIRQLPSEVLAASLPEGTPDDARIKRIFINNCTACHPPGYILQFRFDEAGWNKIINLMKVVPGNGVFPGPGTKPNQILEHNQKQLAAYLARARGPGESSMKLRPRPRTKGEADRKSVV